jgi:hypothetical protein
MISLNSKGMTSSITSVNRRNILELLQNKQRTGFPLSFVCFIPMQSVGGRYVQHVIMAELYSTVIRI